MNIYLHNKCFFAFAVYLFVILLASEARADSKRISLDASLRVDGVYDSNIFLSPDNAESDFLASVNPIMRTAFLIRWGEVNFGVQPRFLIPVNNFSNSNLEKIQHDAYLDFKTFLTERITVTISDRFATMGGDVAFPADQISNTIDANTSRLDVTYKIPLALRTDVEVGVAGTRVMVFDFPSDRTQADAFFHIKRQVGPRLDVGLLNRGSYIIYDSNAYQDVIIYGVNTTTVYELLEDLYLSVPFGVQLLFLEAGNQEFAFNTDISLKGPVSKRTTVEIGYKRGFTVDAVGNTFRRWGATGGVEYEFNSRAKVLGGIEYTQYTAETSSVNEDALLNSRIEFNYRLTARLYSNFGGHFFFNRGQLKTNDLNSMRLFLGLTYEFTRQD